MTTERDRKRSRDLNHMCRKDRATATKKARGVNRPFFDVRRDSKKGRGQNILYQIETGAISCKNSVLRRGIPRDLSPGTALWMPAPGIWLRGARTKTETGEAGFPPCTVSPFTRSDYCTECPPPGTTPALVSTRPAGKIGLFWGDKYSHLLQARAGIAPSTQA